MQKLFEIYKKFYEEAKDGCGYENKYEWVCEELFQLATYDSGVSEKWGRRIIDVCKAIIEQRTFDYIEKEENYEPYLMVCQLLDKKNWIEWGTSIRVSWFEEDFNSDGIVADLEEFVSFTIENLKCLIEFVEDEDGNESGGKGSA
jgi:hypothetical protein